MWTKNPALLAVKRSRTPEYHWRSVAPLPYHNPRKKKSKRKSYCYLRTPKCSPSKTLFSACMQRALFFVFCLVCLHSTPHGRTEHASLLHDTAGRWMRGGPGAEGEAPRYVKWEPGRADKMEPKKSPKSRRRRTCVRAHRYRHAFCFFFFLLCFSAHHRHCRLELRGVGVQRCLYGRSALSCSNVNVPFTIQPGLRRSAPTTLHLFLLLLLGARGKDLIHLRYSNPQRHTPALIRSSVSLP